MERGTKSQDVGSSIEAMEESNKAGDVLALYSIDVLGLAVVGVSWDRNGVVVDAD
jgi:hypothetical protein